MGWAEKVNLFFLESKDLWDEEQIFNSLISSVNKESEAIREPEICLSHIIREYGA